MADPATPDRAAIAELLVSIGSVAVERGEPVSSEHRGFVDLASDDDPGVRRAALPGLALFVDDPGPLRARFAHATDVPEQLVAVTAMGTLALRVPVLADETATWFATLAADPGAAAEVRLAAVVQRVRCAPDRIDEDVVPTAIHLLALMTPAWTPSEPEPPAVPKDVPPHIAAAFADLDRQGAVRVRTTRSLQALHEALAGRVQERTALLTAQLHSPDLGTRLDGIPQCATLMGSWRGDHTSLILLLGEQLSVGEDELAAEAAAALHECHPIAEPARQALAAYLTHHGPAAWASPTPHVRRAYQETVQTLARLGDLRALPSLLWALDNGIDAWRAVQVTGTLTTAADQLVPVLSGCLADIDLTDPRRDSAASAIVSSLAALGDPAALPVLTATLRSAARQDRSSIMDSVLAALGTFGPEGTPALDTIRAFATADRTRSSAVAALWAVGRDSTEVLPLLHSLLNEGNNAASGMDPEPRDRELRGVLPRQNGLRRRTGAPGTPCPAGPPATRRPVRRYRQRRGAAARRSRDRRPVRDRLVLCRLRWPGWVRLPGRCPRAFSAGCFSPPGLLAGGAGLQDGFAVGNVVVSQGSVYLPSRRPAPRLLRLLEDDRVESRGRFRRRRSAEAVLCDMFPDAYRDRAAARSFRERHAAVLRDTAAVRRVRDRCVSGTQHVINHVQGNLVAALNPKLRGL